MPARALDSPPLPPPDLARPLVHTDGDRRTLEFMAGNVQSEMRLSAPDALVLAYCRAIMCFTLFVPRPRHIVMVGLGGGSLAKFCYRYLPHSRITVLELRADVIALRTQFCVPPDDARFRVLHADASVWLEGAPGCADVLIVDGFDQTGLPAALGSARFYGHCRRALYDGGLLVANIFSYDPHYPAMLARLRLMFDNHVCWLDGVAGNNRLLFAAKAGACATAQGRAVDAVEKGSALAVAAAQGRAVKLVTLLARGNGLGAGVLNRALVRLLILWLEQRRSTATSPL